MRHLLFVVCLLVASGFPTRLLAGASESVMPPSSLHAMPLHGRVNPGQGRAPQSAEDPLAYNGGPVMRTLTAYAIYWAPPGHPMPERYQTLVNRYFEDIGGSRFYDIVAQYYE